MYICNCEHVCKKKISPTHEHSRDNFLLPRKKGKRGENQEKQKENERTKRRIRIYRRRKNEAL